MKLEEQITRAGHYSLIIKEEVDAITQIAENFAIGFAEFCRDGEKNTEFWYKEMTIKQLLEIYKKTL